MVWNEIFSPAFYFGWRKKGKIPREPRLVLLVHKMSAGTDGRVKLQRICLGCVMSASAVYNILYVHLLFFAEPYFLCCK